MPKSKLKKKPGGIVERAAEAIAPIINEIHSLSIEDLKALKAKCESLKNDNCWWLEYRLSNLIRQEAEEGLSISTRD